METVGSFWLENGPNENELECEFLYIYIMSPESYEKIWKENFLPAFGHPQSGISDNGSHSFTFIPPSLCLYKAGDKTW